MVRTPFQFEYLIEQGKKIKYHKTFWRNLTKLALVDRRLCGSGAQTTRNLILIFSPLLPQKQFCQIQLHTEERYQSKKQVILRLYYKAELLLLKLIHLVAREVLLVKKLEIEETKTT